MIHSTTFVLFILKYTINNKRQIWSLDKTIKIKMEEKIINYKFINYLVKKKFINYLK
jgi:hypothetical protein